MSLNPVALTIRTKKIGVLIRDVRQARGKTVAEMAEALGVAPETFEAFEFGERSPSLPEIELIAYHLDIPLEHFWSNKSIESAINTPRFDPRQLVALRQRVIGVLIRKTRLQIGLTAEQLAEKAGLSESEITAYEMGEQAVPVPALELISTALNVSIRDFQDRSGPVGTWFTQKQALRDFLDLSPELQLFISKPVNRPYLEVAQRLSETSVEKLRAVAEGLLEITL